MSRFRTHTLLTTAAALAASLAVSAPASAGGDERSSVIDDLYLVATSDGAYVDFQLDRTPASQTVSIDGRRVKVLLLDKKECRYRAIVVRPGLDQGRSYRVRISVQMLSGEKERESGRLFLHKRGKVER